MSDEVRGATGDCHRPDQASTACARRRGRAAWKLLPAAWAIVLVLALPTQAFGFVTRDEIASFGPDGTAVSQFQLNSTLDFDQDSSELYLSVGGPIGDSSPGIFGFNVSSPPLFPSLPGFAPLATSSFDEASGLAVDNTNLSSAGRIYYTSGQRDGGDRKVYGFNPDGSPLGGAFPIDTELTPGPSGGFSGWHHDLAVDSDGNLWVANFGLKRMLEYSASGAFIGSFSTSAQNVDPNTVAFDSSDNLYVTSSNLRIWKYTAASSYSAAAAFEPGKAFQVAVNPANDHVFVARLAEGAAPAEIAEFDAAGTFLSRFAVGVSTKGLAVDAARNFVYVSSRSGLSGQVRVYGAPYVLPDLATAGVTALTNDAVTLNGTVSAQGLALSDCHFEYVQEADFEATGFADLSSGGSVGCNPAAGAIPVDSATHAVSAAITGLQRNTAYRFRLVAANTNGSTGSADAGFQTTGPPIVETTGSPLRTATTARLDARMNPEGAASTYYFEYGDQGPCASQPLHGNGSAERRRRRENSPRLPVPRRARARHHLPLPRRRGERQCGWSRLRR